MLKSSCCLFDAARKVRAMAVPAGYVTIMDAVRALGMKHSTFKRRVEMGWLYPRIEDGRHYFLAAEVERVSQFSVMHTVAARKLGFSQVELRAWMRWTQYLVGLEFPRGYLFRQSDVDEVEELFKPYMRLGAAAQSFAVSYDQLHDGVRTGRLQSLHAGPNFCYVLREQVETIAARSRGYKTVEVVAILGITRKQVEALGERGVLSYGRTVGGNRRYHVDSVHAYAASLGRDIGQR